MPRLLRYVKVTGGFLMSPGISASNEAPPSPTRYVGLRKHRMTLAPILLLGLTAQKNLGKETNLPSLSLILPT
jgi:hypothetical protein